jgi:hypothetical protein
VKLASACTGGFLICRSLRDEWLKTGERLGKIHSVRAAFFRSRSPEARIAPETTIIVLISFGAIARLVAIK